MDLPVSERRGQMRTLELWHEMLASRDISRLDEVLAADCVFYSPVLHSPQQGRELRDNLLSLLLTISVLLQT